LFDCFLGCICWETRIPEIVFHQKQTTRPNLYLASENKPCRYKGSLGFGWQKQTGFNMITLVYLRVFFPANSCATSFVPEFAGDPQSVCFSRHGNKQTHPFGLECRFSNLSSKRCVFPSGRMPFFPAKTFVLAIGQIFHPILNFLDEPTISYLAKKYDLSPTISQTYPKKKMVLTSP
jgi:hypothetical protein